MQAFWTSNRSNLLCTLIHRSFRWLQWPEIEMNYLCWLFCGCIFTFSSIGLGKTAPSLLKFWYMLSLLQSSNSTSSPLRNFVTVPLQAILFPTSYLLTVVPNKQENSPKFTTLRRPNTLNPWQLYNQHLNYNINMSKFILSIRPR